MTAIAAPLGIFALLGMAASSPGALLPTAPSPCHGGREMPGKPPEQPTGCHATQGCAEHRKIRNIP